MPSICPSCKCDLFFSGVISYGDDDQPPVITIKPYKFKLALDSGPHFALPHDSVACSGCGSIWSTIRPELFNERVSTWLKGDTIKDTSPTQCKSCKGHNAIIFKIRSGYRFDFDGRDGWFWEVPGFWVSNPKIEEICRLCKGCGVVEYKTDLSGLLKKAKKFKLSPKSNKSIVST